MLARIALVSMLLMGCKSSGNPSARVTEVEGMKVESVQPVAEAVTAQPVTAQVPAQVVTVSTEEVRKTLDSIKEVPKPEPVAEQEKPVEEGPKEILPPKVEVIISLNLFYKLGSDSGNVAFKNGNHTENLSSEAFDSIIKNGLSCDLTKVSDVIYSCDYSNRSSNCSPDCPRDRWSGVKVVTDYKCTVCRKPRINTGKELFN